MGCFPYKGAFNKNQSVFLRDRPASVSTASLYAWLLIFRQPFANIHFLLNWETGAQMGCIIDRIVIYCSRVVSTVFTISTTY